MIKRPRRKTIHMKWIFKNGYLYSCQKVDPFLMIQVNQFNTKGSFSLVPVVTMDKKMHFVATQFLATVEIWIYKNDFIIIVENLKCIQRYMCIVCTCHVYWCSLNKWKWNVGLTTTRKENFVSTAKCRGSNQMHSNTFLLWKMMLDYIFLQSILSDRFCNVANLIIFMHITWDWTVPDFSIGVQCFLYQLIHNY